MANIDKKAQAFIDQVLHRAGVLKTDGDANELHRYAIKRYQRMNERKSVRTNANYWKNSPKQFSSIAIVVGSIKVKNHWHQVNNKPVETKPTRNHQLAHLVQLSPKEREVMYLLVVARRSEEEIVAELGVSKEWVEVTINKIKHIFGQVR